MKNLSAVFFALLILSSCKKKDETIAVSSVTIEQCPTAGIHLGEPSRQLTAVVKPDNATSKEVTWISSNPSVATVSGGLVTPVKDGETTVSAKAGDITAACKVTILPHVAVTGIFLEPATVHIVTGETSTLEATVTPANASDKTIVWSSDKEDIASVTNGTVTAKAIGICTITAKSFSDQTKTAACAVTVVAHAIPLTGLSLDAKTAAILLNATRQLKVTIDPENATNRNVTWTASNASVAQVSSTGLVTAKTLGTATITVAGVNNPSASAACTITVTDKEVALTGLTPAPADTTVAVGAGFQLRYRIEPVNATNVNVTFESGDPAKAGVSEKGFVAARALGETTITVKSAVDPTKMGTCRLTVKARVESITVSPNVATVSAGQKQLLIATVMPDDAACKTVIWSSSDHSKATVSDNGEVTAVAPGEVRISATARDGGRVTAFSTITVTAGTTAVAGISLKPVTMSIVAGQTSTLEATIAPENASDKRVIWISDKENIATVSEGIVTAKEAGTCIITAKSFSDQTKTATCEVMVVTREIPIKNIWLDAFEATILMNDTRQLITTITPKNATNKNVTWTTSNAAVAEVSATGLVTAKTMGTATVTVTSENNPAKTTACAITVTDRPIALTGLEALPADTTIAMGTGFQLRHRIIPVSATHVAVTYESNDVAKALVSATGYVTALAAGATTITVKSVADPTKMATCRLTIKIYAASLTVSPREASISVGQKQQLTATVMPGEALDKTVSWNSSDELKATVNNRGEVTAVAPGEVIITATAGDGSRMRGTSTLTILPKAVSIRVSPLSRAETSASIAIGTAIRLAAVVLPANAKQSVIWSSDATDKAAVSNLGIVRGLAAGVVTIIATAADESGITGTFSLSIIVGVTSITLTPVNPVVGLGKTTTFRTTVSPAGATQTVTWSSSDPSKATIDAGGVATGRALGTTTITATANDGSRESASTILTVKNSEAGISAITLGDEKFPVSLPAEGATTTIANIPHTVVGGGMNRVPVNITKTAAEATIKIGTAAFTQEQAVDFSSAVTFTVTADDGATVKNYTIAVTPYNAATNPYGIYTTAHLHDVRNALSASFKLMNDLTMPSITVGFAGIADYRSAGWSPIGDENNPFTGSLDGGGHKISDFYIYRSTIYAGLFGKVANGASLKSLGVDGQGNTARGNNSNGKQSIGMLAGYSEGAIDNCYALGEVSSTSTSTQELLTAGGLVGHAKGSITGSFALVNVSGRLNGAPAADVGGLVGFSENATITGCYAAGNVYADADSDAGNSSSALAGGLIGDCQNSNVNKCYAKGNVSGISDSRVHDKGSYAGGLVGRLISNSILSNSFASGNVSSASASADESFTIAGGLVGQGNSNCVVSHSYALGNVTSLKGKDKYTGGLIGNRADNTFANTDCYRSREAVLKQGTDVVESQDKDFAGLSVKPLADMKTAAFRDNLNSGQLAVWGQSSGKNDDLPYIIGVGVGQ